MSDTPDREPQLETIREPKRAANWRFAQLIFMFVFGLEAVSLLLVRFVVLPFFTIFDEPGELQRPTEVMDFALRGLAWASVASAAAASVLLWRGSLSKDKNWIGWRHWVIYLAFACLVSGTSLFLGWSLVL